MDVFPFEIHAEKEAQRQGQENDKNEPNPETRVCPSASGSHVSLRRVCSSRRRRLNGNLTNCWNRMNLVVSFSENNAVNRCTSVCAVEPGYLWYFAMYTYDSFSRYSVTSFALHRPWLCGTVLGWAVERPTFIMARRSKKNCPTQCPDS